MDDTFSYDAGTSFSELLTESISEWWRELSDETKGKLRDFLALTFAGTAATVIAALDAGLVLTILLTAACGAFAQPLVVHGLAAIIP